MVGAVIALAFVVIWFFFSARRRRARDNIAARGIDFSPTGTWRPPLEDEGMVERTGRILSSLTPSGLGSHSTRAPLDGELEDAISSGHGHSSVDGSRRTDSPGPTRSSSFGYAPYMAGFGQAAETIAASNGQGTMASHRSSRRHSGPDPGYWLGGREMGYASFSAPSPTNMSSSHGHSTVQEYVNASGSSREITAHLTPYPPTSSSHGSSGSSAVRGRTSGDIKIPRSQIPPTSFNFQGKDKSDTRSFKSLLVRLRGGRDSSPGGVISRLSHPRSNPSSPVSLKPSPFLSRQLAHKPSSHLSPQTPAVISPPESDSRRDIPLISTSVAPWTRSSPMILTPLPSAVSEDLPGSVHEGLLDPRLNSHLSEAGQASSASSLRDNMDYSRPIGGVCQPSLTMFSFPLTFELLPFL